LDSEGSIAVLAHAVIAKNADGTATVKQGDEGEFTGFLEWKASLPKLTQANFILSRSGGGITPIAITAANLVSEKLAYSLVRLTAKVVQQQRKGDLDELVCKGGGIIFTRELLGAPPEDWKLFSGWASDIFRIFNNNLAEDLPLIEAADAELEAYLVALIDTRRATPGTDLLSDLIAVEEAGDRLSTDELVSLAVAVLMAGTDTTRNQLACALALFAEFPDQWDLLGERPELAPRAVEEAMRYLGAVRGTVRFAPEDIVFHDVLFPRGTLVSVFLAAANRDPGAYDTPETFDITRERGVQQMTFGSGIHHCMGAALARAELQEALVLLARRMPGLAVDGPVEWKPTTFGIWGPARLPLRFSPVLV